MDGQAKYSCGDSFQDYYSNPADLLYALIRALPHLPLDMAAPVKNYLRSEFNTYPPYSITHLGWQSGSSRDFFDLPPEVDADRRNYGPTEWMSSEFEGWGQKYGGTNIPPHVFYVLWKYAQALGYTQAQARDLLDQSKGRLDATPPSSDVFVPAPICAQLVHQRLSGVPGTPKTGRHYTVNGHSVTNSRIFRSLPRDHVHQGHLLRL